MRLEQFLITPAAGKRLIGRGMTAHPAVQKVLVKGRLVIVAGTTNGYVAEEILTLLGQREGFSRVGFRRGLVAGGGAAPPATEFPGDVVIIDGNWRRGKQVFDVRDELSAGDVVLKGGNALNLCRRQAGVYIGHPEAGTAGAVVPLVAGRCVRLICPIGLEKRVNADIHELANRLNSPDSSGPRMLPLPGEVFCELDAITLLTGARASLLAAGGVYGAEGGVFVGVEGDDAQLAAAHDLLDPLLAEPPCEV